MNRGCEAPSGLEFKVCLCDVDEVFDVRIESRGGGQEIQVKCERRCTVPIFETFLQIHDIDVENIVWSFDQDEEDEESDAEEVFETIPDDQGVFEDEGISEE